jgi:choline-sulfatase
MTGFWDNAHVYDGSVPSWHHRLREQGHNVTSIGKLHFRSASDDNGFSEEIIPMHMVEGGGALFGLLRAAPDGERPRLALRKSYEATAVGEADYITYDCDIVENTVRWLQDHAKDNGKPWVLLVSFTCPHPPFVVPKRLLDLYDPADVLLPPQFRNEEQPQHPSIRHIRKIHSCEGLASEDFVRRTLAGYYALTTFMDEQIGRVMSKLEDLRLMETTRVMYTSDHGEAAGAHGLFGKSVLYEHSIGVPLVACGKGIKPGQIISQLSSHVDLFPTILESVGASLTNADYDLPGSSLWPAMTGSEIERTVFAEYHGHGSKTGTFMIRKNDLKLIYHVDAPSQLFNLREDPLETCDLMSSLGSQKSKDLEEGLRGIVDPEAIDQQAKKDQLILLEKSGGVEAVLKRGTFGHNPIPGRAAKLDSFAIDSSDTASKRF